MAEWLEIIRVLGAFPEAPPVRAELESRIEETRRAVGLKRGLIMTRASYGGDFAVVLLWENASPPVKTREGMAVAEYLRQFGSVDHAVWRVMSDVP